MPYTFAEAGADDVNFACTTTAFANQRVTLITGWFRKTGAGDNTCWSFGTAGNRLDWTATGELRMTTDRVTTDGVWTTSGLGLAADTWYFIAFLSNTSNTSAFQANTLWVGTIESAPVEVSMPVGTSPSGNATGTQNFYIGNFGTSATDSFGGDIADVVLVMSDQGASATAHPFYTATFGTTTAEEAKLVYERYVLPIWIGEPSRVINEWLGSAAYYRFPLDSTGTTAYGFVRGASLWRVESASATGVSVSQNGPPRPVYGPPFGQQPLRRR